MKKEGSFLILVIIPSFILVGLIYLRQDAFLNAYSSIGEMQMATYKSTQSYDVMGRQKGRNGKLLTDVELAIMEKVDQVSKTKGRSYEVASKRYKVKQAVQLRRSHGVPTPVILKWNFKEEDAKEKLFGTQCGGCRVTSDRKVLNESVALIIFWTPGPDNLPDPKTRKPGQAYVFWSSEVTSKLVTQRRNLEEPYFDPIFNFTMNYRRESDFVTYWGNAELALRESKKMELNGKLNRVLKSKNRLAAWYVSNCYRTPGAIARMRYVMAMVEAGLKLDKFGRCSTKGERKPGSVAGQSLQYKFYLSFENSIHCPSYVSEKFWRNAIGGLTVPVVFGPTKEDVLALAPKNSFIHTEDFASPGDLVRYLNYLDSNNSAYMEYHAWRFKDIDESVADEKIGAHITPALCRLCKRLVLENHPPKIIPSIAKWFFDMKYPDNECLTKRYKVSAKERKEMEDFFAQPNAYQQQPK